MNNFIANFLENLAIFEKKFLWLDLLAINKFRLVFAAWNIILALIPLAIILYLKKYWWETKFNQFYQKVIALILGFIWLLFIPNAAYLIVDVRHLVDYCPINSPDRVCPENAWMILFFFTYAIVGWAIFYYSIRLMRDFLAVIFNKLIAKIFVACLIPTMSLGILLGLLNRWNSWDFFIFPRSLVSDIIIYFTLRDYFIDWLIFTVFFYILYLAGNLLFRKDFYGLFKNR